MSIPPKTEFLEGPGIDACLVALHDAVSASVVDHGGSQIKSFAVLVRSDIGVGVVTDGCMCEGCQVQMMAAFAEANGARCEIVKVGDDGAPEATPPVLHS
jgi:hypothetical protein